MAEEIINRVAQSGIVTLDLEEYYISGERIVIDLKENLFMGLVLKEKDFRDFIKNTDWTVYKDKYVVVTCTADAIVPTWAFMLVATKLANISKKVVYGSLENLESELFNEALLTINPSDYLNKKVVIKGCSKFPVPLNAYLKITDILTPFVSSLMFGEPCSTVPLFKKSKS